MGLVPTDEQAACIDTFNTGDTMIIEALAGTGKTTSLKMIADGTRRKGLYAAFNKSVVTDAKAVMPQNVKVSTFHSVAYGAVGWRYKKRLGGSRVRSERIAAALGIDPITFVLPGGERRLAAGFLGGHVLKALNIFCTTADDEPSVIHFPLIDGLDLPGPDGQRRYDNNNAVAAALLPALRSAWADVQSPDSGLVPFQHGMYLKMWALTRPVLPYDFVMIDEAQDLAPVVAGVIGNQDKNTQLCLVGDPNQCQPTGTMVTVVDVPDAGHVYNRLSPCVTRQVPIEDVREGDRVVSFDVPKSYLRRTGASVVGVAARPFDGHLVEIETDGLTSSYTPNHRCVVRIGDALAGKWVVYMMRRGNSYRIGMVKGVYETQQGSIGLSMRVVCEKADAAWVLSTHDSEVAARLAEAKTSWMYHIPPLRFQSGGPSRTATMTQDGLDEFWDTVGDLTRLATVCLDAHGRKIEHPLCGSGGRMYRRRSQVMQACNLLDGMLMLPLSGALDADGKQVPRKRWTPITVRSRRYVGLVHSLDVEGEHTYVADGIVTHNSIYGFTGAVDAMARMEIENRSFLTESWRFGPEIANQANVLLALLDAESRLKGRGGPGRVGKVAQPHAILSRTNALCVRAALNELKRGGRPAIVGGADEVIRFAKAADQLESTGFTSHPELACFKSWTDVQEYVSHDANGSDLALLVSLIDEFGAEEIIAGLSQCVSEASATLILSTAHKSKGRQWPTVRLADDFPQGVDEDGCVVEVPDEELRLLYVAATRAETVLDHGGNPIMYRRASETEGMLV